MNLLSLITLGCSFIFVFIYALDALFYAMFSRPPPPPVDDDDLGYDTD